MTTSTTRILNAQHRDKGGAVFNPKHKDFGAVGDGVANDTTPLSSAATGAAGAALWVPMGTYLTTAATAVPANTSIAGAGRGAVIKTTTVSTHLLTVAAAGVTLRALKLLGVKGSTVLNNSGALFSGATDGELSNSELTGMSGMAAQATASDNIRFLLNYIHDLTPDATMTNGCDIGLVTNVSYCMALFNRLKGGAHTELGILNQDASIKHLELGNIILDHDSYGIIDYDPSPKETGTIAGFNRIENIGAGAFGSPPGQKGAGMYAVSTGLNMFIANWLSNTNIATTSEGLAPGAIGLNSMFAPHLSALNMIVRPNWYGINVVSCRTALVSVLGNVLFECLKIPIYGNNTSHASLDANNITGLTTTPKLQRGIGVNVVGAQAWSSTASYVVGDVVLSGGIKYRAIAANTNQVPPNATYWVVGGWQGVAVRSNHVRGHGGNGVVEFADTDDTIVGLNLLTEGVGVGIKQSGGNGGVITGNVADLSSGTGVALTLINQTNTPVTGNIFITGGLTFCSFSGTCTGSFFDKSNVLIVPSGDTMNYIDNNATGMVVEQFGNGAPALLHHQPGDKVWNKTQTAGAPVYWLCVAAGVPGTWVPVYGQNASSSDNGDTSPVLTTAASVQTQRFDTALTANRTVTLPTPATSFSGQRYRVVRTGLGAFTLTVQTDLGVALKAIPSATPAFVDVEFSAPAGLWKLTGYGPL